ncbi:hypothetical protein ABT160_23670 [Streptomyces sp. NPDC001941]
MSRYLTPEDAALAGASVLDGPDWAAWDDDQDDTADAYACGE